MTIYTVILQKKSDGEIVVEHPWAASPAEAVELSTTKHEPGSFALIGVIHGKHKLLPWQTK